MKIIDKTPLQDEKGEISASARIQGTLKFGLSWYSDLQAQKAVIQQLEQVLEKGYVLIRNFTLPGSDIVIPMILMGPSGTYVIAVSDVKGFFEAKGDQWNEVKNNKSQPAGINLISRVVSFSKVLQKYLQKQRTNLPGTVEPILICANPGAHVDSVRPAARVVKSDAIRQFATSILQARPVMRNEQVYDFSDRIVDPRPLPSTPPPSMPEADASFQTDAAPAEPSRAKAIFNSAQTAMPESGAGSDLNFSFDENASASPAPAQRTATRGRQGMSVVQIITLVVLGLMALCAVLVTAYIIIIPAS